MRRRTNASDNLSINLEVNLGNIRRQFINCADYSERVFQANVGRKSINIALLFLGTMVNSQEVNQFIIKPLMQHGNFRGSSRSITESMLNTLNTHNAIIVTSIEQAVSSLAQGRAVLLADGSSSAIAVETAETTKRDIGESPIETVIKGPRESFVENIDTNIVLLRKRIPSNRLKFETFTLGRFSKTRVMLAYIKGIAREDILEEARRRISRIDIDAVRTLQIIEELISDNPYSLFRQMEYSERPDKVAANMLDGRIAILTDRFPHVYLIPTVLWNFLQSAEDHLESFYYATFSRFIRVAALFITVMAPAVYVAFITFHHDIIPTNLLISIAAQKEGVPFPTFLEVFLIIIAFELIREAGIKLPTQLGQAISIVGVLIIGDSAVQAGLVSPITIIVVAFTGLASFGVPAYGFMLQMRILQFVFLFSGSLFGLFGIFLVSMMALTELVSLRSFGIPYLSPIVPLNPPDIKDTIIKMPWQLMKIRPYIFNSSNERRQKHENPHRSDK